MTAGGRSGIWDLNHGIFSDMLGSNCHDPYASPRVEPHQEAIELVFLRDMSTRGTVVDEPCIECQQLNDMKDTTASE